MVSTTDASLPAGAVDELTGLLGRNAFIARLDAALDTFRAGASGPPTLLLLDLDRFKQINDSLGHAAGDVVLRGAASRIRARLRRGDLAARLGGDEFACLLLPPVEPEAATTIADRLVDLMSRPFLHEGQVAQIGLSIGIGVAEPALSAEDMLKRADLALYAAKHRGRGRYATFEPALQEAAQARHTLARDLRAALALDQFVLVYQPLVDVGSGRLTGAETLLRWERPGLGRVGPPHFLSMAEELGLMPMIGAWVLREACAECATWPDALSVSVNVAPSQFADGALPGLVAAALHNSKLQPGRLELEVTEETLMRRGLAGPIAQFKAIRALGVRIAMDDFGTGYSSLAQLRAFPFDRVKLDRSFADDLPMMRVALGVGRALGLSTTAEGIENAEQLDAARREGCQTAQGFLIGKPLELDHWRARITATQKERDCDAEHVSLGLHQP